MGWRAWRGWGTPRNSDFHLHGLPCPHHPRPGAWGALGTPTKPQKWLQSLLTPTPGRAAAETIQPPNHGAQSRRWDKIWDQFARDRKRLKSVNKGDGEGSASFLSGYFHFSRFQPCPGASPLGGGSAGARFVPPALPRPRAGGSVPSRASGEEEEGATPSSSLVKTQGLRHTNHPRQLQSRCNSFAAPICCERERGEKKPNKKKTWKKPEMSNITGEASQNRCPHLAPTAASSHRIRGVPGRTLPCSCLKLSERVNKKPPQQRLETFGCCCCRRLHILWNKAQSPGAGASTVGWQGRDWEGSASGAACARWVFWGKTGSKSWRMLRGG